MSENGAFSVGCFHFGLAEPPEYPFEFTGRDYVSNLRAFLEAQANVSSVSIETTRRFEEHRFTMTDAPPNIQTEPGAFAPNMKPGVVDFELTIPERLQEQLTPWESVNTNTERFRVTTRYQFHAPVTFVETVDADDSSPSEAVGIVREFLTKQFEASDFLRFGVVGPSPAHVDCYVVPAPGPTPPQGFTYRRVRQAGYDDIRLEYDDARFASAQDAMRAIFLHLGFELDLFYFAHQVSHWRLVQWSKLDEAVDKVVERELAHGLRGHWRRLAVSRKDRNEPFLSIATFEKRRRFYTSALSESFRSLYEESRTDCFKMENEAAISSHSGLPLDELKTLLGLFETRRTSAMGNLIVAGSTILGVAVGALITGAVG